MDKLIMLIGPSACGKSTIEKGLVKRGLRKAISYTSREMRKGEKDGVDYYYTTKDEILRMYNAGELIEFNMYNGNYYGVSMHEVENSDVIVIDPNGADAIDKKLSDKKIITPIYIVLPEKCQKMFLELRGDSKDMIKNRMKNDRTVFKIDESCTKTINYYPHYNRLYYQYKYVNFGCPLFIERLTDAIYSYVTKDIKLEKFSDLHNYEYKGPIKYILKKDEHGFFVKYTNGYLENLPKKIRNKAKKSKSYVDNSDSLNQYDESIIINSTVKSSNIKSSYIENSYIDDSSIDHSLIINNDCNRAFIHESKLLQLSFINNMNLNSDFEKYIFNGKSNICVKIDNSNKSKRKYKTELKYFEEAIK